MGLRYPARCAGAALAAVLTGCASLPDGRPEVDSLVAARGRPVQARNEADARKWLAEQLGRPLTVETAVQIALANNPRMRAEYARLGIAGAEVYEAGRLSNPRLSASVLAGGEQVTFGLAQNFTSLLMLGPRSRLARGEFERVQSSVGAEILSLAAETEAAFLEFVGARQVVKMRESIARAGGLSVDLAQRFFDAGNITRLELALEKAAASQAQLELLEAQAALSSRQAALNALLGLPGGTQSWSAASGLSSPLPDEDGLPELLKLATESRLDLHAARQEVMLLADSLGVVRRFRYLGEVEIGVETEKEEDEPRHTGPNLSLELPIFNQGRGAVARARAQLQDAEARLQELEIAITNGVELASARVASAKARAEAYRSALVPLREEIVTRTQEQVNYMLVGQFELLRAKQEEYDAYQGYLEAVADYWIARADLAREVGTRLPSSAQRAEPVPGAEEFTRPKGGGVEGMQHEGMEMEDHSGHGQQQKPATPTPPAAAPREKKPAMPPPRKGEPQSGEDMPTGMESHVPGPAGDTPPEQNDDEKSEPHQHGDPR
jgi:cobalt-zinc-cadmium efflux system outer membrane protein